MSKDNHKASAFFKKESSSSKVDFNLLPQAQPPAAIFQWHELNAQEVQEIEQLLIESSSGMDEEQLKLDIQKMKHITSEVKSISKQGIILIGERIKKAREILSRYGDESRTFTAWLLTTFGSRRTAYNTLSYYEFYTALPTEGLKEKLKNLPLKAAYALASRRGELEEKIAIITDYCGEKPQEIIERIQQKFPVREEKRLQIKEKKSLDLIERELQRLMANNLSNEGRERLRQLMPCLDALI